MFLVFGLFVCLFVCWGFMLCTSFSIEFLIRTVFGTETLVATLNFLFGFSVTYPEFFWADRYTHRTHEGAAMSGGEWRNCQNLYPLALSFLRFFYKTFSKVLLKNSYIQIKHLYGYKLVRAAKRSELKRCHK